MPVPPIYLSFFPYLVSLIPDCPPQCSFPQQGVLILSEWQPGNTSLLSSEVPQVVPTQYSTLDPVPWRTYAAQLPFRVNSGGWYLGLSNCLVLM